MLYKLYLLDLKPHSLQILKYTKDSLRKRGHHAKLIVPRGFEKPRNGVNVLTGIIETDDSLIEVSSIEDAAKNFLKEVKKGEKSIAIIEEWPYTEERKLPIMEAIDLGSIVETGFRFLPRDVHLDRVKVANALSEIIEKGFHTIESESKESNESRVEKKTVEVDTKKPMVYVIAAECAIGTPFGTGIGNLCVNTISLLIEACSSLGYDLTVSGEEDVFKLEPEEDDIVVGITMNNAYMGGTTLTGQGFKLKNLIRMSEFKTKQRPFVVTSLHPGEAKMYGIPNQKELEKLKNLNMSAFNRDGIAYLRSIGLNTTSNVFPIPMNRNYLPNRGKNTPKKETDVKVLFQMDTQHRKNGEYILCILLDAINLALKEERLTIEVVAKATASHAIGNSSDFEKIIKSTGLDPKEPFPGVEFKYEMRTSDEEWRNTLDTTDIGVFLSTEEGLHMFVAEFWLMGINCIVSSSGYYPDYDKLEEGVIGVPTYPVPSGGTGIYNDWFETRTRFPEYNSAVKKVKKAILELRKEGDRTPKRGDQICTDHKVLAEFLGMRYNDASKGDIYITDKRYQPWLNRLKL